MTTPIRLLRNKTALITGGTTGIGRAIALSYASHGARVAVNHLDNDAGRSQFQSMLKQASENGQNAEDVLLSVPGDVSRQEDAERMVKSTVDRWGRLDVFVSHAGVCGVSGLG